MQSDIESRVRETGLRLYSLMEEEPPPIFNRKTWAGKVIGKCLQSESFKIDLFRFIDVFPYLNGPE